eukprot:1445125-Pleurochrysis_carterae.AAC.2
MSGTPSCSHAASRACRHALARAEASSSVTLNGSSMFSPSRRNPQAPSRASPPEDEQKSGLCGCSQLMTISLSWCQQLVFLLSPRSAKMKIDELNAIQACTSFTPGGVNTAREIFALLALIRRNFADDGVSQMLLKRIVTTRKLSTRSVLFLSSLATYDARSRPASAAATAAAVAASVAGTSAIVANISHTLWDTDMSVLRFRASLSRIGSTQH